MICRLLILSLIISFPFFISAQENSSDSIINKIIEGLPAEYAKKNIKKI